MKTGLKARARLGNAARAAAGVAISITVTALSGCGGSPGASGVTPATAHSESGSSFLITSDNYGVENATYLSATGSGSGVILRAAVASSLTDPDYQTVFRIDIPDSGALASGVYSLGDAAPGLPGFPGCLYLFNGHQSTRLETRGGTITLTAYGANAGATISGSFRAVIVDGGDSATPKPSYSVAGSFSFVSGSYGPITPAPLPVPVAAASLYDKNCASCHSLGAFDPASGGGPELALKGGRLDTLFPAGLVGHQGISLASRDLAALKILLNVN